MAFLSILLTSPLVYVAYNKKHTPEKHYILRLFLIWLLVQVYFTINNKFRFPVGLLCCIFIVKNTKFNKMSKIISMIIGFISLMISYSIYLLY